MKKILFTLGFLLLVINLTGCAGSSQSGGEAKASSESKAQEITIVSVPSSDLKEPVDSLQVYYFHGVNRCNTCLTIGKYVRETIEDKYSSETENGKIDYMEINIDELENKDLVNKFEASGSSLYINAIRGENETIEKDMYVWRVANDETAFKIYLEDRINSFLIK